LINKKKFKKILIINTFGIGDVLFTTPLVRNIRNSFKDMFLGYLCNIRTFRILETNPNIDKVFIFEKDYFRQTWQESKIKCLKKFSNLLNRIKKEKFDAVVDLSLGRHYSFFCWLVGIKKRIGFNYKNRGFFLTDKINIDGYERKHVVEYYLDLLKYLGINYKDAHLDLFIPDQLRDWSDKFLADNGIDNKDIVVAIVPGGGASWGKDAFLKRWYSQGFAKVADKLSKENKIKILVLGDPKERDLCESVVKQMESEAFQCCGKTDIMQFASLLSRCNLAITNDGGPLHVAVAVGTKTVSIFGPVDDKVYGPYPRSNRHKVMRTDLSCQPCYHRFKLPPCDKDRECLKSINIEQVYQAAKELLS